MMSSCAFWSFFLNLCINLEFNWISNCSDVVQLSIIEIESGSIDNYDLDSSSSVETKQIQINGVTGTFRFRWSNLPITESKTCCWRVSGAKLVPKNNQQVNVTTCYGDIIYGEELLCFDQNDAQNSMQLESLPYERQRSNFLEPLVDADVCSNMVTQTTSTTQTILSTTDSSRLSTRYSSSSPLTQSPSSSLLILSSSSPLTPSSSSPCSSSLMVSSSIRLTSSFSSVSTQSSNSPTTQSSSSASELSSRSRLTLSSSSPSIQSSSSPLVSASSSSLLTPSSSSLLISSSPLMQSSFSSSSLVDLQYSSSLLVQSSSSSSVQSSSSLLVQYSSSSLVQSFSSPLTSSSTSSSMQSSTSSSVQSSSSSSVQSFSSPLVQSSSSPLVQSSSSSSVQSSSSSLVQYSSSSLVQSFSSPLTSSSSSSSVQSSSSSLVQYSSSSLVQSFGNLPFASSSSPLTLSSSSLLTQFSSSLLIFSSTSLLVLSSSSILILPSSNPSTQSSSISSVFSSSSILAPSSSSSITQPSSSRSALSSKLTSSNTLSTTQFFSLPRNSLSKTIRLTTLTSSSMLINPSPIVKIEICVSDGEWPLSLTGTNVTLNGVRDCFNGTVEAIRFCQSNGVWGHIHCVVNPSFTETLNQITSAPVDGLRSLSLLTEEELSNSQFVFLLNTALLTMLESSPDIIDNEQAVKNFLNVTSIIISSSVDNVENSTEVGSQLLQSLDSFALTLVEPSDEIIQFDESFLSVQEVNNEDILNFKSVQGIRVSNNFIDLPSIIFYKAQFPVRIASFLFNNLSHLLVPRDANHTIVSPIISASTNCESCPIIDLTENITIQLQIQNSEIFSDKNLYPNCAFYNFKSQDGLLPSGDWNTSGCTTKINGDLVTCSCNHLTHFAILLSPGGPEIDAVHHDILNLIGLVLVPISLVCMLIVILTYTFIRSLWSIRNYIHIMLCVSMFMAQLVFIIGVDKTENWAACSAVAVILLYLFLVTFMWMLMEGVVLYVTLVTVLITNRKYYIIGFTVTSYVVPAVYMMLITPIGYLVNTDDIPSHTHFLYYQANSLTACWLNYSTGFVWSFIVPVILIIIVNVGFFIMTLAIAKRHNSSKLKAERKFIHWLQVSISLTVIMGLAWLVGVLAFRKELLPVAYIMTVFIAAQGILFFIILIPLSKQVRTVFKTMWTKEKKKHFSRSYNSSTIINKTGRGYSSSTMRTNTLRMSESTSTLGRNSTMKNLLINSRV